MNYKRIVELHKLLKQLRMRSPSTFSGLLVEVGRINHLSTQSPSKADDAWVMLQPKLIYKGERKLHDWLRDYPEDLSVFLQEWRSSLELLKEETGTLH